MATESFKMSSLTDLTGKVALVTGGGTGLGLMMAKGLATNGARVYVCGRRFDKLEDAAKTALSGSGGIRLLTMDVNNKESIERAVEGIERAEGKLNILINNAGIVGSYCKKSLPSNSEEAGNSPEYVSEYAHDLLRATSFEDWGSVYQTNVSAVFFATMAFLPLLNKGATDGSGHKSSVINISSIWGQSKLNYGVYQYSISKAACTQLTLNLATDFALRKIPVRVNAISPGQFPSELSVPLERLKELAKTNFLGTITPLPAGRPGEDEEIAALAVYLASKASDFMTGQNITLDGGVNIVNP